MTTTATGWNPLKGTPGPGMADACERFRAHLEAKAVYVNVTRVTLGTWLNVKTSSAV